MSFLLGTVTATTPLLVTLDGSSTAVPTRRLASYTPAAGDRVLLVLIGTQALTFGRIV